MSSLIRGLVQPFAYGRGFQQVDYEVSPAAGASYTHTVPGKQWERLIACTFTLTTSSATADRLVSVQYARGADGTYYADGAPVTLPASQTGVFYGDVSHGQAEWNTGTPVWFSLYGGFLSAGTTIKINVASIDTADQLSAIALTLEKFPTGEGGFPLGGVDESEIEAFLRSQGA